MVTVLRFKCGHIARVDFLYRLAAANSKVWAKTNLCQKCSESKAAATK